MDPSFNMTAVVTRRGERSTGRRQLCEGRERQRLKQLQANKHHGMLANTRSQRRQGQILLYEFQKAHGPSDTLILHI